MEYTNLGCTGLSVSRLCLALTVQMDEPTEQRLDDLFPPIGNGGPAPEAWAW